MDIYYSGFTTVEVWATDCGDALARARDEVARLLKLAVILDPDGAMTDLLSSLEPWESCDTATIIG